MNTITLVATDLDGTFLNSKKEVSKLNQEAISALKHKGILFGIASGRPVETVHAMLEDWKIEDSVSFIMGMNGGVIYDIRRRTKEEFHLLDGKIILDIINFYKDMDVIFHVLVGDIRYTSKSTEETRAHAKLFGETEIEVNMESFLKERMVNKLIIYCDPAYMPKVVERSKSFKRDDCVGFSTANNLFEYCDPAINKGYGIKKVCKHFGVNLENCVAFGDEANDIQMLDYVGMGVCMKNGCQGAKDVADYVSEYTNDEDALGKFLFDHVLKEDK